MPPVSRNYVKICENRLTPGQQSLFPGDHLFDKLARAVCRAKTLPRKELYETREMDTGEFALFPDNVVVSAHALGALTDPVLGKADKRQARGQGIATRKIPAAITPGNRPLPGEQPKSR